MFVTVLRGHLGRMIMKEKRREASRQAQTVRQFSMSLSSQSGDWLTKQQQISALDEFIPPGESLLPLVAD